MTDKVETIRAEIERREKIIRNSANQISNRKKKIYYSGGADALLELLSFIDSLQQEQPNHLEEALKLVAEYNLKPYRDGNAWCILLGEDIQSGICGFGDTLTETYLDFLKSYEEYKHPIGELLNGFPKHPVVDLEKDEYVGVAESPLKIFQRVNEFEEGASYRH